MLKRTLVCLILVIKSLVIFSQTPPTKEIPVIDYTDPKEYIISGVKVSGVQFLDKKALISMSGLVIGRKITVPGDEITKLVEKYWAQGLFSDVKIIASEIKGDSIWFDIQLKEHHRLAKMTIKGVKKGDVDDLTEKIGIKPGAQVNDNVLNNVRTIINKFYKEKGFWNVKIDIAQKVDTVSKNRVFLAIDIKKGKKVKIASIAFTGNTKFTEKRLRRTLKKTKQISLNFFKSKKYVESNYKEDKEKLADFYAKNGYRDYMFLSDSIKQISPNRITLKINIHEGNQYHLRNITWVGNTKFPTEGLNRVLMMKKGDVYDLVALDKRISSDEDAIHAQYQNDGYLFSTVDPVETRIENDSVDLEIRITEGRQAYIKNIIITGNTKTNENVVRRELLTIPGQLFSRAALMDSYRRLGQLGHFNPEKIVPTPIPNQSDGTVDIKYGLEEKANDQLEVSGGWGGNMLVGTLGLRFNNFSASNIFKPKAWRPVPSGDGQSLSLRAQTNGSYYKAYSMSFTDPWFGGKKPNSFSFSIYHQLQNGASSFLTTSNKNFKVTGGSIGLGRRLNWPDNNFSLYNEVAYQRYKLENWSGYFIFDNGTSHDLSYKIALQRTSTDQTIYPREGSTFLLSLQLTPPYSAFKKNQFWLLTPGEIANTTYTTQNSSDYTNVNNTEADRKAILDRALTSATLAKKYNLIEYHKWTYKGTWYYQLVKDLVLCFNSQFGYLGYYNRTLGYSPFQGYSLGGDGYSGYALYGKETIGLRGYQNESLTPRDPVTQSAVANIYTKLSFELRYPITLQSSATVYGLVFVEGGNSWLKFEQFNPFGIKRSAGVGVRAFLPMFGLLGIDWGYGFDAIPGNPGANKGNFHFVMGQQF